MDETDKSFSDLVECIKKLGWEVAIPSGNDDDNLIGMSIGTPKYIDDVLSGKYVNKDSDVDKHKIFYNQ